MKNRYIEVDILKIFACICVIVIHISAALVATGNTGVIFINCMTRFAVPCFIFASGLILMVIYKDRDTPYLDFQKKRLNSVLAPYLTWAVIFLVVNIGVGAFAFNARTVWNGIVWGNSSYHLYFMIIIIQLYLLFPIIKAVLKALSPVVAMLFILAYQMFYTAMSPMLIANFKFVADHYDRLFTTYLTYFLIGALIGAHYQAIKDALDKFKLQILTSLGFLYVLALFGWTVSQLPGIPQLSVKFNTPYTWVIYSILATLFGLALASVIAQRVPEEKYGVIELISAATFYVYLGHPLLLSLLDMAKLKLGITNPYIIIVLDTAIITAICFALSIEYIKFKKRRKEAKTA